MKAQSLLVRNFRNIQNSRLEFSQNINFIVGNNGQGKTSLLEAIGFLATCRSFRSNKNEEVVSKGKNESIIEMKISDLAWDAELKTTFLRDLGGTGIKRTAFINGKPFHSSAKYLQHRYGTERLGFHAVIFNPADHDLVRGEPSLRRNYLDRVISAENPEFLITFRKYQRTLLQKNTLLKNPRKVEFGFLKGFNELLAETGSQIILERLKWLKKIQGPLYSHMHQIAPNQSKTSLFYYSKTLKKIFKNEWLDMFNFTGQGVQASLKNVEQVLLEQLQELEKAEIQSQTTLIGPHREDWQFFIGSNPLKGHGSQGEVRSVLLGLKLAEIEQFKMVTGHLPVLLLDDFSSELDQTRRRFLMDTLFQSGLQVFITTTDSNSIFESDASVFVLEKGQVVEAKNDNTNHLERGRLLS